MTVPAAIEFVDLNNADNMLLTQYVTDIFSDPKMASFFGNGGYLYNVFFALDALKEGGSKKISVVNQNEIYADQISLTDITRLTHRNLDGSFNGIAILINIGSSDLNGSTVNGVSGTPFSMPITGVIFHELFHVMASKYLDPLDPSDRYEKSFYDEQIAVFAENALYGKSFHSERQGHLGGYPNSYLNTASDAQTGYIGVQDNTNFSISPNQLSAVFTTVDSGSTSSSIRTYWRGLYADGESFRNYVTTERNLETGATLFAMRSFGFGFYIEPKAQAIMQSSIVAGGTASAERAYNTAMDVAYASILSYGPLHQSLDGLIGSTAVSKLTTSIDWSQNRTVMVATERFVDQYTVGDVTKSIDRVGPVSSTGAPLSHFFINDESATEGAYLFGGGGFIGGGGVFASAIDMTNTTDRLYGGSGNDVIAVGTANRPGDHNIAMGNIGADILIGREGSDWLQGGAGNDILVGFGGGDILDGGDNFDIVSYQRMTSAITINNNAGSQAADGDSLVDVEMIIGTSMDDTFTGNGQGSVFFGGVGSDTFNMRDGDIAIGGENADNYYVTTSLGGTISINMDYLDKLYVNGILYDGIRLSGTSQNNTLSDNSIETYQTLNTNSSFKHTVETRLVATDKGVGYYPDIDKTKPFDLMFDDHPERSESFVWDNRRNWCSDPERWRHSDEDRPDRNDRRQSSFGFPAHVRDRRERATVLQRQRGRRILDDRIL